MREDVLFIMRAGGLGLNKPSPIADLQIELLPVEHSQIEHLRIEHSMVFTGKSKIFKSKDFKGHIFKSKMCHLQIFKEMEITTS